MLEGLAKLGRPPRGNDDGRMHDGFMEQWDEIGMDRWGIDELVVVGERKGEGRFHCSCAAFDSGHFAARKRISIAKLNEGQTRQESSWNRYNFSNDEIMRYQAIVSSCLQQPSNLRTFDG